MKEYDDKLTIREIEELCNLYMDCALTSLEEAELEYVLLTTDSDSEIIRETRAVMGLSRELAARPAAPAEGKSGKNGKNDKKRRIALRRWRRAVTGIAASAAILVASVIGFSSGGASEVEYIAYVGGRQLRGEEAREVAEAQIERYRQLERRMDLLREEQKQKLETIKSYAL